MQLTEKELGKARAACASASQALHADMPEGMNLSYVVLSRLSKLIVGELMAIVFADQKKATTLLDHYLVPAIKDDLEFLCNDPEIKALRGLLEGKP